MASNNLDDYRDSFGDEPRAHTDTMLVPPEGPSGCARVAKGCGCAVLILVLVLAGLVTWIALSWKQWAVYVGRMVAGKAIAQAPMDPADRQRLTAAIDKLGAEFAAGRITVEQMRDVMEALAEGPVMPLALVMAADTKYLQPSGLSLDEKRAGRRTLERIAHGVVSKTLPQEADRNIMHPVMEQNDPDDPTSLSLKKTLSDAEIRDFLASATAQLDAAGVPNEPYEVNIAAEIDKAISSVIGKPLEAGGN